MHSLFCLQPDNPLALLRHLWILMKHLVAQIASQLAQEEEWEKGRAGPSAVGGSESLTAASSRVGNATGAACCGLPTTPTAPAVVATTSAPCPSPRPASGTPPASGPLYSSLNQPPDAWALQAGQPCGGERWVLLLDRWAPCQARCHVWGGAMGAAAGQVGGALPSTMPRI
jgi:hypothetical protein